MTRQQNSSDSNGYLHNRKQLSTTESSPSVFSRGTGLELVHSSSVAVNEGRSVAATTGHVNPDLRCRPPQRRPGQSSQLLPSGQTRPRLSSTLPTSSGDDETLESNASVPGYRGYTSFVRLRRGEQYTTVGGHFETIRL